MAAHRTTSEDRFRMKFLLQQGASTAEIALETGYSQRTVREWARRLAEKPEVEALKTRYKGRRRVLNAEQEEEVVNYVIENPFSNSAETLRALNLEVSVNTIRRTLRRNSLQDSIAANSPAYEEHHKQRRIEFAQQHANRDWRSTIFSDEKVFDNFRNTNRLVYRPDAPRLKPGDTINNYGSGRITLVFAGWMSAMGPGELIEVPGRMNSVNYCDVLDTYLATIRAVYGEEQVTFVHDNSAIYTAFIVQRWFAEHPQLQALPWPAHSADLNPIENLWGIMTRHWEDDLVAARTEPALRQHVFRLWESYRGIDYCARLVDSVPRKLEEVLKNMGGITHY